MEHVDAIGKDLEPFDEHQKARWHLQRGLCLWFSRDDIEEAANLFLKAHELYPDDEKMAAAKIRGLMLRNDAAGAEAAGKAAIERFPVSLQVWLSYANARLTAGAGIALSDIPSAFRDEPDALQFVAISVRAGGDVSAAAELAEQAADRSATGYFTRATFLRLALEDCVSDPVQAHAGLLPEAKLARLQKAVGLFDPRKEKIWDVQSDAIAHDGAHLGFAFLITGRPETALEVAREAKAAGVFTGEILRVEMQALAQSGKEDEALSLACSNLDKIAPEALAIAGELAANRGDPDLVLKIGKAGTENHPRNKFVSDYLTALHWGALARAKRREEALSEIANAGAALAGSLILKCAAARVHKWAGMLIEASDEAAAAEKLLGADSPSADILHVADLLAHLEMWDAAAALYERLAVGAGNGPSEIHARLLECLVETGNRAKARSLLAGLPEGWAEHEETRRVAINFGFKVGDWAFLLPLARKGVEKHPNEAWSWLFLLRVLLRTAEPEAFMRELRSVPERMDGSINNLAMLASTEIKFGEKARGMARLYKLVRASGNDSEALSAYLINFLTAGAPPEASPSQGSFVEFEDANSGQRDAVCIDPPGMGALPKAEGFLSADAAEALPFLEATVGKEITLRMLAGGERRVRVVSIATAYQRLASIAQERAGRFQGIPHLRSVPVGNTGDAEKDLAMMHEILRRSSEANAKFLEAYASGGLTLSLLAKAMGRSAIEVCAGWPSAGPALFVGSGLHSERDEALAALAQKDAKFVVDSTALAELAMFGMLKALDALPKLLISTATKEVIDVFALEVESDESFGSAFDNDGKISFIEFDERRKKAKQDFAQSLRDVALRCEIAPAYIDLGGNEEAKGFARLLSDEEREALLLAKERGAALLTLDGRLRGIAKQSFGVSGVWPQAAILHALGAGVISARQAAEFNSREFMSNREFVSLRADDLIWMLSQGDQWLQQSFAKLKPYLSATSTDRDSSFAIAMDFLRMLSSLHVQTGAFAELISHLAEAFFRRRDCAPDTAEALFQVAKEITLDAAPREHISAFVNVEREVEIRGRLKLFASAIRAGKERAMNEAPPRPVRVRVLHCAARPSLVVDNTSQGDGAEMISSRDVKVAPAAPENAGAATCRS